VPADPAGAVYGEALYEAAEDRGEVKQAHGDLQAIGQAMAENLQLTRVLFNPAFPEAGKKQILQKLTAGSSTVVQNAVLVLVDHGRITALPDLIEAFDERYARRQKQLEVELTTAVPIDDAQAELLRARLAAQTGADISLSRKVDPSIVGGLVLRVRDLLIDASVRGKLDSLRLSLRKARLTAGPATPGGTT
jgi:F-type H+-transporting ATPase subunit delta